jgi:hypothetical protein
VTRPCPGCNKPPTLKPWHHGYLVTCEDCYDPTGMEGGDSSTNCPSGFGVTKDAAYGEWNEQVGG